MNWYLPVTLALVIGLFAGIMIGYTLNPYDCRMESEIRVSMTGNSTLNDICKNVTGHLYATYHDGYCFYYVPDFGKYPWWDVKFVEEKP